MTDETATLVASLREALRDRKDVHLAVLFGSRACGRARPDSDVDVAVQGEGLDLLALAYELSLATHHEVDVVDLARAGYPLLKSILRDAVIVHQGQRGAGGRWLSHTIAQLETDRPWYERMRDAYLEKLAGGRREPRRPLAPRLAERIERVRRHCPPEAADLAADLDAFDLVSFNLMLAVQACLDLASHLISDEGWPPAETHADAFLNLHEHGVLSQETAETLGKATGLRNIVAHGYAGVDPELIHHAAVYGLADLERFAREVSGWMEGRRGDQTDESY